MEQITLRVPEEQKESLENAAQEEGESLSEHIRKRLDSDADDDANTERIDALQNRIESLREELAEKQERIDDLRDDREERIRLEAKVDQLGQDLERVREERDAAQARYNEAQGKLKVHSSEKGGVVSRVSSWFSR